MILPKSWLGLCTYPMPEVSEWGLTVRQHHDVYIWAVILKWLLKEVSESHSNQNYIHIISSTKPPSPSLK